MPLTSLQKAEKRARAAMEAGRPYEARTMANQAVVAQLQEEAMDPEQHGVKRLASLADAEHTPPDAPLVKRSRGAFAKRESQKYQNHLYDAQLVIPPPPEDPEAALAKLGLPHPEQTWKKTPQSGLQELGFLSMERPAEGLEDRSTAEVGILLCRWRVGRSHRL